MQLHSYDSGNQYSHKGETEVHTDCLASQTTTMLALPIGKNVQTDLQFCSVDPSMCHTTPKASTYIGGWVWVPITACDVYLGQTVPGKYKRDSWLIKQLENP